jgi:hypothetical protein
MASSFLNAAGTIGRVTIDAGRRSPLDLARVRAVIDRIAADVDELARAPCWGGGVRAVRFSGLSVPSCR